MTQVEKNYRDTPGLVPTFARESSKIPIVKFGPMVEGRQSRNEGVDSFVAANPSSSSKHTIIVKPIETCFPNRGWSPNIIQVQGNYFFFQTRRFFRDKFFERFFQIEVRLGTLASKNLLNLLPKNRIFGHGVFWERINLTPTFMRRPTLYGGLGHRIKTRNDCNFINAKYDQSIQFATKFRPESKIR